MTVTERRRLTAELRVLNQRLDALEVEISQIEHEVAEYREPA